MLSSSKTTSKLNIKTESDSAWLGLLGSFPFRADTAWVTASKVMAL